MNLHLLLQQTPVDSESIHLGIDFQIGTIRRQMTRSGKPYLELEIADGTGREKIKLWADTPAFDFCEPLQGGESVHATGRFSRNSFGLNVEELQLRRLSKEEQEEFFAGSAERIEFIGQEYQFIQSTVAAFLDPRLRLLCQTFLEQFGDRFKRAAAAREIHHARRGGLIEHTAQMMRSAVALAPVYPQMNGDLLCAGVLFHDCGKLWENDYAEQSFVSHPQVVGELLGHISIGIELVNKLWRTLESRPEFQETGTPSAETVRQHLLHLIASHHGQKEYGAPVTPRTPEGWALHYIDNLDARIEMMRSIYADKPLIAPGIHDYKRPLEGHAVTPLAKWQKI